MKLHSPFIITPRLLPGLKIGENFVSLEYAGETHDGRTKFRAYFDIGGKEFQDEQLKSGCQGGNLRYAFGNLLAFLGSAAESYAYSLRTGRPGENADLFAPEIVEWAYQNLSEIDMLRFEIEETENLIDESA